MKIQSSSSFASLASFLAIAAPWAHAGQPQSAAPAATVSAQSRITVQSSGRGYTRAELQAFISRAVVTTEAESSSTGHQWLIVLQTGRDNRADNSDCRSIARWSRPARTRLFQDGFLGTTSPIVFTNEIQSFARMLISQERHRLS